jgi:SAM-dependent methyltransferase
MSTPSVDWNKYAVQYDSITMSGSNPAYLELVDKVTSYFSQRGIRKGSLIVDMGGGTGNFSLPLAERFPDSQFAIVDLSSKMLEIAKHKADTKKLANIDFFLGDVEDTASITDYYKRPLSDAIMMHALYATRSVEDMNKPERILMNLRSGFDGTDSRLFISDINRKLQTNDWVPYCLSNAYRSFRAKGDGMLRSSLETFSFFRHNDQAKMANAYIDMKQNEGAYLLCSLDEFTTMIRNAGFQNIYESSAKYYRGRDNLIIAGP